MSQGQLSPLKHWPMYVQRALNLSLKELLNRIKTTCDSSPGTRRRPSSACSAWSAASRTQSVHVLDKHSARRRFIYYRKVVLHLLKCMFHFRISRYNPDLR